MNYYKRHLGDYARDTGHLSALEHGVYTLLLDWYYVNEKPIPEDRAVRIARGNHEETMMVLNEFFKPTAKGWVHSRADREIREYIAKAEKNRESGKLGGRPKKTIMVSERLANETLATSHKPLEEEKAKACASSADEAPTRSDPIPYQRIADLYNQTMKLLPKVAKVNASRKTLIRRAWEDGEERKNLEFWTAYFEECEASNFLNGKGPYTNGHENWRPDFDYLMQGKTILRTYEKALTRMEQEQ